MTTFTRRTQTLDAATDTLTSSSSTVTGSAIQVRGAAQRYAALGLNLSTMPTLFFTPDTYGSCPAPGDTVSWNSVTYTVRDVEQIAPDGVVIAARVIVGAP